MMVCAFTGDGNALVELILLFIVVMKSVVLNVASTSSVSLHTTSDYRLKENVKPMSDVWDKIKTDGFTCKFYMEKSTKRASDNGFIDSELQEICPEDR